MLLNSNTMPLRMQLYLDQLPLWPSSGRHILAQFDADSIIVYQAYCSSIAHYAVANQRFGGDFSFARMSWIKPNFLWMMYRAGWAGKEGQEHILAVRIRRTLFDEILETAIASSFGASGMDSHKQWQKALLTSEVRLQWDPDHAPSGKPEQRRAVQLGLRGHMLRRYAEQEVLSITDITPFVLEQKQQLEKGADHLVTPEERLYLPVTEAATRAIQIDTSLLPAYSL